MKISDLRNRTFPMGMFAWSDPDRQIVARRHFSINEGDFPLENVTSDWKKFGCNFLKVFQSEHFHKADMALDSHEYPCIVFSFDRATFVLWVSKLTIKPKKAKLGGTHFSKLLHS